MSRYIYNQGNSLNSSDMIAAIVKKGVAVIITLAISVLTALALVSCGDDNKREEPPVSDIGENDSGNTNDNTNQAPNPDDEENKGSQNDQDQNNCDNQEELKKQELIAQKTEIWNNWKQSLLVGNYKAEITTDNANCVYSFDGNVVKEETVNQTTYFVFEDGAVYELVSTDGENFEKQESTILSAAEFLYNSIADAVVVDASENGSFIVQNAKTYTVSVDDNGELLLTSAEGSVRVSEVGEVELEVPEVKVVENIYEFDENGNMIFNCALIGSVVENWFKGDNQYGEDYLKYQSRNAPGVSIAEEELPDTKKVLYVKASRDYISVVLLADYKSSGMYIAERHFNSSAFYNSLQAGEIKTADELKNYLNNNRDLNRNKSASITDIEYTTEDEDYADHKEMFETLTQRVFDRIETVGTHSYIDTVDENSTMDGFSDSQILFAYKTKPGEELMGSGLGQSRNWAQNYIVLRNGEIELVQFSILSSTYAPAGVKNCYENVLADPNNPDNAGNIKNWLIIYVKIVDILDETNLDLWTENENVDEKDNV